MINLEDDIVLEGYGVKLKRLTHDKIEMLRQWRNDPKIQQHMFYREYITPEMQERWFAKLDKRCNFYFIIEYNDKEIGLINVKDIDYEKMTGEGGVFIYDDIYLNSDVAYRAHLVMFDYFFEEIKLQSIYSHMISDNIRAIRFAQYLGCVKLRETDQSCEYNLTRETYLNNKNRQHFLKRWNYYNKKKLNE